MVDFISYNLKIGKYIVLRQVTELYDINSYHLRFTIAAELHIMYESSLEACILKEMYKILLYWFDMGTGKTLIKDCYLRKCSLSGK